MTRRDVLLFLFRWKNTILGWWLFTVVLVVVLAYVKPPVYQTVSSVLIERTKAPVVIMPSVNAPEMKEAMTTEAGIVTARPVFETVVDELGLDKQPAEPPGPVGRLLVELGLVDRVPAHEAWIRTLASGIKAEPVVDSNLLDISFKGTDPTLTARIVNAVTDAYMAHRQQVYAERGASAYLKTKRDDAEGQLQGLRDQLSALKSRYGLTAVDEAKAQWTHDIGTIQDRISTLIQTRNELETLYTPDHPKVRVVQRSIDQAEAEIAQRKRSLSEAEAREAGLKDLEARIEAQQKVFFDLKAQYEDELAREQAPRALINSRVVQYAPVPLSPRFSRLMLIELGVVTGLFLALVIAFIRQYFDQRVHDPDAAEAALGLPVLGSIPRTSRKDGLRRLGSRA
jgi:tyrosine-protein kinase Etk/Wzc